MNYYVTGRMPRRVHHLHFDLAYLEHLAVGKLAVRWRRLLKRDSVDFSLPRCGFVQSPIERMQIDRDVPTPLYRSDATNVIDVGVGDPDRFELGRRTFDSVHQFVAFAARIDHHRAISAVIDYQVRLLLKRPASPRSDDHASVFADSG